MGWFMATFMNHSGPSHCLMRSLFLSMMSVVIKALTKRRINDTLELSGKPAPLWMYEEHLNEDDTENKSTEENRKILNTGNNGIVR